VRDLRHMISLGDRTEPGLWRPPVVKTVAARAEGLEELMEALDKHGRWLADSGMLRQRRVARAEREVEAIAVAALRSRIGSLRHGDSLERLAADVVDGRSDPYAAADQVLDALV
jgi:LAO/AO transport system kinase